MKIVVSACLLGENCKYNGGNNYCPKVAAFLEGHEVIPVCPELEAGLGCPRVPMELVEGVLINKEGAVVDGTVRAAVEKILRRLEGANMLTVYTVERNGRLRKYYHITEQGIKRIGDFKEEWKEILAIYQFVSREENEK